MCAGVPNRITIVIGGAINESLISCWGMLRWLLACGLRSLLSDFDGINCMTEYRFVEDRYLTNGI